MESKFSPVESRFSTLDFRPEPRPTGYRVAVVLLGLGLVGAIGAHLQGIGELRREFAAEAARARACQTEREALAGELKALRAPPVKAIDAGDPAPADPRPLALPPGDTEKHSAAPTPKGSGRSAARGSPPSEDAVASLIGNGQASLQACYHKALRHDPDLGMRSLRLRLSFTMRSSGDVTGVAFKPSPGRELRACLRDVVGDWRVRPFGGGPIGVVVPITLTPQG